MVTPIGPGSGNPISPSSTISPTLIHCTYDDLVAIAEEVVFPVYQLYQASGWQQSYQTFIAYQWNNYTGVQSPNCNGCCWLKKRTLHWINGLASLTPGSYNYHLKEAKIAWGLRAYKYCCDPGITDDAFYNL